MAVDRSLPLSDRASDSVASETNVFDRDAGHSNYMAFLLGGLMVSIGLLAFTFYDSAPNMSRDVATTGSLKPYVGRPASAAPSTARP